MVNSAHEHQNIYDEIGIDLSSLGCVMLDVDAPNVNDLFENARPYVSKDPKRFWINGINDDHHITVRYGLLNSVRQEHVLQVLKDVQFPEKVFGSHLEVFQSPYPDESYECIVLRIHTDPGIAFVNDLLAMREALGFLPNVNTFPGYKAHVTLGYVHKGWSTQEDGMNEDSRHPSLFVNSSPIALGSQGLNLGQMRA